MAVAVVDTGVLIGMVDTDDQHHDGAMEIVREIDHGTLPTGRETNYELLKTLNWIHTRKRHQKAVDTYSRLNQSAGFELVHAAQKDFTNAIDRFKTRDGLAFGDATIAAYMDREGIEYIYSFDNDFDSVDGITRLDTAENPFS